MGGFETTAHTLSFTLFALAANPHVQARLAAELAAAGLLHRPGGPARQLEPDDLRMLPYLCNVLKESMRMYPVVAGIPRCAASRATSRKRTFLPAVHAAARAHCSTRRGARARRFTTQTTQVGDYLVPPGVFVYVLFHRLHNNAKYWRQPDVFRPERWEASSQAEPAEHSDKSLGGAGGAQHAESASSSEEAKVYLPFSEGSRSCVAQACTASLCCNSDSAPSRHKAIQRCIAHAAAAEPGADGAARRAGCALLQF
jgi:cytochrome P450